MAITYVHIYPYKYIETNILYIYIYTYLKHINVNYITDTLHLPQHHSLFPTFMATTYAVPRRASSHYLHPSFRSGLVPWVLHLKLQCTS